MENYYDILGVQKDASKDKIKRAFRQLAKEHHPDKNDGSSESTTVFRKIYEAYETLSDDEKRAEYDRVQNSFNGNFNFNSDRDRRDHR